MGNISRISYIAVMALLLAGCGSSGSGGNGSDPPPPPPPPPPSQWVIQPPCSEVTPTDHTLVAGDIVAATRSPTGFPGGLIFYAIDADTLAFTNLTARNGCERMAFGGQVDARRQAAMQDYSEPVADPGPPPTFVPGEPGVTVSYRMPSTVAREARGTHIRSVFAFTDDPEQSLITHLVACMGPTGENVDQRTSLVAMSGVAATQTIWDHAAGCGETGFGDPEFAVAPGNQRISWVAARFTSAGRVETGIFDHRPGTDSAARELVVYEDPLIPGPPLTHAPGAGRLVYPIHEADNVVNHDSIIHAFIAADLDQPDQTVEVTPDPADGMRIKAPFGYFDGRRTPILGDGSGVAWYEANWEGLRDNPPADADQTSPLWFASIDNPGVRVQVSDAGVEFIHAYLIAPGGQRVFYAGSGADRSVCSLWSVDPAAGGAGVLLESGLDCERLSHGGLAAVRRPDPAQREALLFRTGDGWSFRWADGSGEALALPAAVVNEATVDPGEQWLYHIDGQALARASLVTGAVERLDFPDDYVVREFFIVR